MIAEADQQEQINIQALNKLWFKSSHLGVGCPEAGMYFPREMMLSQHKHIYPWCAWSSKNTGPNHFVYQCFHGKIHSEFPPERLLDTFLHHWGNGEPMLETESLEMFSQNQRWVPRPVIGMDGERRMEEWLALGTKGTDIEGQVMLGEEQKEAHEGEGWDKNSGEERRKSLRILNSLVVNT